MMPVFCNKAADEFILRTYRARETRIILNLETLKVYAVPARSKILARFDSEDEKKRRSHDIDDTKKKEDENGGKDAKEEILFFSPHVLSAGCFTQLKPHLALFKVFVFRNEINKK